MGKWRAGVLIGVHVVFLAHFIYWLVGGMTVSPVEPSESMYTLELGQLNAGFIFFALALLSTFIFGRYFCGWGCHVVALQDLCSHWMNKMGVRPKPFRTRLLVLVPLLVALYMFVWPTLRRTVLQPMYAALEKPMPLWLGRSAAFPGFSNDIIVTDFWATFPPWYVAIPFLGVCGFAIVYFLGSKGFCTYGCPYGGFFAPVDKVSIGRIVVNDDCEHCGHCTAVCTSNVRVHQEVRDYGMVVDPGCMKCMDCVSVCPNDALSFKFARPAVVKKARTEEARSGKVRRPDFDLSLWEEAAVLALGLAFFIGFRGMLNQVPLLMAVAMAAILAFCVWKLSRMVRTPNVRLQSLQLRHRGRTTRAGRVFAVLTVAGVIVAGWSAAVRYNLWRADLLDQRVNAGLQEVFSPGYTPRPDQKDIAEAALAHLERGSEAGFGWKLRADTMIRKGWLHAVAGDLAAAEDSLRSALTRGEPTSQGVNELARIMAARGKPQTEIRAMYESMLAEHPDLDGVRVVVATFAAQDGKTDVALESVRTVLTRETRPKWTAPGRRFPDPEAMAAATELMVQLGKPGEALELIGAAADRRTHSAQLHAAEAVAAVFSNDAERAVKAMRRASELEPRNLLYLSRLFDLLNATGRTEEAEEIRRRAEDLTRPTGTGRGG